jgi:hypothetical protein
MFAKRASAGNKNDNAVAYHIFSVPSSLPFARQPTGLIPNFPRFEAVVAHKGFFWTDSTIKFCEEWRSNSCLFT